ncbi:MAG TPA: adenylate/guanylate cyclase domain-containing protein [Dongiaceae bacterium]
MKEEIATALVGWLIDAGLNATSEENLIRQLCERLVAEDIPLTRVMAGSGLLHPIIDSRAHLWRRGSEVATEEYARLTSTGEWERSPFHRLWAGNEKTMRRRLNGDYQTGEFELLDKLKAAGATDYLAIINRHPAIGGKLGDFVSSWAIDRPSGFTDAETVQLERIGSAFALSYQSRAGQGTMRTLLETYLGRGAAARVLNGNVIRGQADTIDAVIWYSDLVNFTRIADEVERDHLLSLLNDYAACLVESIEQHGGEVLKFIGDGILAIFPDTEENADNQVCAPGRALDAAMMAERRMASLNESRQTQGLRTTDFYLALHVGDLSFGNFGSASRLDFTVLGPAVNEASRIGTMCRSLDQRVIVSSAFADSAGARRRDLVSLGRYALRGVGQPQELFTLDRGPVSR